ncbi:SGNH/GDSL hydrolase family protein [Actinomadura barringtoniae]|uniref:SGNH/GDSL hydrolase family protein n=1 Tax=Actinomadura barringtoniae TaxID=1427535 RepID=A0A939TB33_9ACTN|nr:SGNH/GDSL hydrolase family protein [Actinomadura barringtoniae]MBO2453127.1 SGNH/GDSL hydrolase family protein [Actinomadura barringtoniae]
MNDTLTTAEAAELLKGAPWQRLAIIGDSVAEGIREPTPGYRDLSWTDHVEEALRTVNPGFTSLNLGLRNLLAAQVREQQLEKALAFEPDLAIVTAGGNDMFRRRFDDEGVRAEIAAMVGAFRAIGADVVTIGLLDLTKAGLGDPRWRAVSSDHSRRLAELTADVATELGAIHVYNGRGSEAETDPGIYSSDQIHLNARGHAIAAANTIRTLADHLADHLAERATSPAGLAGPGGPAGHLASE